MTYIIDIRTPIGNFGGTLKDVRTDDLGSIPIKELINRTGIDPKQIDDVILGCANQAEKIIEMLRECLYSCWTSFYCSRGNN